jgi:hypothetical protein
MNALSNMVELKSKDINSGFDIKNELKILDEIKVDQQREMKINTNKSKILLTGVTGFLGTQMLHELLTKKGNMIDSVYCLIRPSALREDKSGLAVVKKRFKFAELDWNSEYDHIIKPVSLTDEFLYRIWCNEHHFFFNFRYSVIYRKKTLAWRKKNSIRFADRSTLFTTWLPTSIQCCLTLH